MQFKNILGASGAINKPAGGFPAHRDLDRRSYTAFRTDPGLVLLQIDISEPGYGLQVPSAKVRRETLQL